MLHLGRRSKVFLTLVCLLVVAMRISGAHLHLCFDGSEPPASVHFDNDGGVHHLDEERSAASSHSDVDVNLIDDALLKLTGATPDLLDLFGALAFILSLFAFRNQVVLFFDSYLPIGTLRAYLRPPLRGPPR